MSSVCSSVESNHQLMVELCPCCSLLVMPAENVGGHGCQVGVDLVLPDCARLHAASASRPCCICGERKCTALLCCAVLCHAVLVQLQKHCCLRWHCAHTSRMTSQQVHRDPCQTVTKAVPSSFCMPLRWLQPLVCSETVVCCVVKVSQGV